ncbi:MAG: dehydrogenase [halophilic archaeon J07HX5]|jgi:Dehydrogenases with different specificities (related to short-chain alcohol dehydrogenases)|nr:MAG: dehydrogenase [halophilic archaeon J07HX5]
MPSETVEAPEFTAEAIHYVDDPSFDPETVALVTGAASGIGRATALALAANGLTVAGVDVDEAGLAETIGETETLDTAGRIEPLPADLTDDAAIEAAVEAATKLGSLSYVANIAGFQHIDPIEEFPMDTYDRMHAVMVRAPLYLSQLALPAIRESGDGTGCIGNMASVHGHYVTAEKVGYNVSKFALRGLTQSIAAEGDGEVRSFSVSTGYVATPLVVDQIPDTAASRGLSEREVVEDVLLGQARRKELMAPVDVANLFVLGFSELATHLNGGDLLFDGGMTGTYS